MFIVKRCIVKLIDTTANGTGEEIGTTYNLKILRENGSLMHQATGITQQSYTWTNYGINLKQTRSFMLLETDIVDYGGALWLNSGCHFVSSSGLSDKGSLRIEKNGYLSTANTSLFEIGKSDFTIEFFIKPEMNSGRDQVILDFCGGYESTSDKLSWQLIITASGALSLWCASNYSAFTSASRIFTAGISYHVAVSRINNTMRFFINGKVINTFTCDYYFGVFPEKIFIGAQSNKISAYPYTGLLNWLIFTVGEGKYTSNYTPLTTSPVYNAETSASDQVFMMELESVRDNLTSYQKHSYLFKMGGD